MVRAMRVGVDGAELWVEQDGDGVPVIVPTGGGVEFYRRTFSPRFRRSVRVLYVEMRGTGGSTGCVADQTFASLADDVEAVRLALGLGPAIVLGHSNHGCIALEHGLRHPEGNAGVVSVASVLDGTKALPTGMARWEAEATAAQQADLARRMAEFDASPGHLGDDEAAIRRYLSFAPLGWRQPNGVIGYWGGFPVGAGQYFHWMTGTIPTFDGSDRIGQLRPPLLTIAGRYDYLCPVETWAALEPSDARQLVVFEDSAHNPQLEEQARFDELVLDFVQKVG
jgi:proline iminopeptidase